MAPPATEAAPESATRPGLEGVVAVDTRISRVDGAAGRLVVRGLDLEDVAARGPFEGTCALLWDQPPAPLRTALGRARAEAFAGAGALGDALARPDGMAALRAALAHEPGTPDDPARERLRLTAAVAVHAAAWARRRAGREPLPPDPGRGHAEDLLRMITGEEPDALRSRALDVYLTTAAEHGMNASTFAARVVASTGSDTVSALVAAVGALKGPLHGGVPGPVLDMLDAIGEPARARPWLEEELASGRRLPGFGHRVYRVRDPRVAVLEGAVDALAAGGVAPRRLELARAVEREAVALLARRHPGRALAANVEFGTAVLLHAVGLDRGLFTPVFAAARVAGWLAHVDEERRTGRLIRPQARYVGPLPAAA